MKKSGWLMFNLVAVYYLEYTINTGLVDLYVYKLNEKYPEKSDTYVYKNGFTIFYFCY